MSVRHLTLEQAKQLQIGNRIDYACGLYRTFWPETVTDTKPNHIKVSDNIWCDYTKDLDRIAYCGEYSQYRMEAINCCHRYRVGDLVDINVPNNTGWKLAKVTYNNGHCLKVKYKHNGKYKVHTFQSHEIETSVNAARTYTKKRSTDELFIWLKTKRLLPQQWETKKCDAIKEEVIQKLFGSDIHALLKFIVDHLQIGMLRKMTLLLQQKRNLTTYRQTDIRDFYETPSNNHKWQQTKIGKYFVSEKQSNNKTINRIKYVHKQHITSMMCLPQQLQLHVYGFVKNKTLNTLKGTCYNNYLLCGKELKKKSFGVFNTNKITNGDKQFIDTVGFNPDFIYDRYSSIAKCSVLTSEWGRRYNIPTEYQFLVEWLPSNSGKIYEYAAFQRNCITNVTKDVLLFDKRNVVVLQKDEAPMTLDKCNNDDMNNCEMVVLKWFDIFRQQIKVLQFVYLDAMEIRVGNLCEYIENSFVCTTKYQRKFHEQLLLYLEEMKEYKSTKKKLITYDERIKPLSGGPNLYNCDATKKIFAVRNGRILSLIFQFNPSHEWLFKSRFFSLTQKYNLLYPDNDSDFDD